MGIDLTEEDLKILLEKENTGNYWDNEERAKYINTILIP
jgi:hypothetical protein